MSPAARIEEEAARWLLQREEPGWSEADAQALEAWLADSSAHQAAFWRLEHGWRRADRIAARPLPSAEETKPSWSRRFAPLAASVAALLGAAVWLGHDMAGRIYATDVGGHEIAPLPDGTRVELNTDTRLRADVTRDHREVWLDKGEAYFEVAHDKAHPFTIYAGKRKVTVLGTRFSVRRSGDEVQVTVVEGRVRVDPTQAPKPTPATVLTAGQIAIAKGAAATLVTPKTVQAAKAELSWRQGMLVFDQYTVERAAEEFNRYNRRKIVVSDAAAGAIRIGGTFETDNIDGFVELLQQGYGLKIEKTDDEVKITG
jgi:transmembrane sensor